MKHIIFTLLLILGLQAVAQQMTTQAPSSIPAGTKFMVQFSVDDRCSDFRGPSFKGLSALSGPNQGTSQSMSIINGRRTSSFTTTFSYLVVGEKEGTYTVGAASCVVDGKKVSSEPFTIKVTKADPNQQSNSQQRGYHQQRQGYAQEQPPTIDEHSLFAKAVLNKSNPYRGEQVIVSYRIYTQVSLQQYQIDKLPGNKGFWAEDLSDNRSEVKQWEETIDGKRYLVAEIRRGALFAQEDGKLSIEPLDLDVLAMVPRQRRRTGTIWDLFDDPFFNSAQAIEKHLRTPKLNVNVRPLPAAPEGFSGGVGNFNIKGDVDTRKVKANEAITYKITVSGSGNLMLIDNPTIAFPSAFEVYDPEVATNLNKSDNGVSGSKSFEWVLIPRSEGNYSLPELQFIYFDPATNSYVTRTLPAIDIEVEKGDPNAMAHATSNKNDVKKLNNDINYIKTGDAHLRSLNDDESNWWFWLGIALIGTGTIAAVAVGRRQQAMQQDVVGTRLRRATKEARRRLRKAATHLKDGNDELFYQEIYQAIWGCIADKYNIELSRLSSDTVQDCLIEKGIDNNLQQQILQTLKDVDYARFAPGDSSAKKQNIYDEALQMIASL